MNPILLTPFDLAIAAVLIVLDGVLSLVLRLQLHAQLALAAARMVVQLILIGFVLRLVFAIATFLAAILALTTAIRPHPWYDARYAIPLAGIVLGNVLNSGSIALDSLLGGVVRERAAIEAQHEADQYELHHHAGSRQSELRMELQPQHQRQDTVQHDQHRRDREVERGQQDRVHAGTRRRFSMR